MAPVRLPALLLVQVRLRRQVLDRMLLHPLDRVLVHLLDRLMLHLLDRVLLHPLDRVMLELALVPVPLRVPGQAPGQVPLRVPCRVLRQATPPALSRPLYRALDPLERRLPGQPGRQPLDLVRPRPLDPPRDQLRHRALLRPPSQAPARRCLQVPRPVDTRVPHPAKPRLRVQVPILVRRPVPAGAPRQVKAPLHLRVSFLVHPPASIRLPCPALLPLLAPPHRPVTPRVSHRQLRARKRRVKHLARRPVKLPVMPVQAYPRVLPAVQLWTPPMEDHQVTLRLPR
jgi:hypothetical protein